MSLRIGSLYSYVLVSCTPGVVRFLVCALDAVLSWGAQLDQPWFLLSSKNLETLVS